MDNKHKVFVIMPFSDEHFEVYEMLKNSFEESFIFSHAGEEDNQQNILADIIGPIYEADIVLADLTGLNPNVMYELGIAHSFNKKTIIITQDELSKLPFDLKQYRTKDYSTHFKKFNDLISYLKKNMNGAIDGSVVFSNPVVDFLDKNKAKLTDVYQPHNIESNIPEDDKGFIDFIADIETDMNEYTEHVNTISAEMNKMNLDLNNCSKEIQRGNPTGSNTSAAFIRKQAKKAAECIKGFSVALNTNNNSISVLWDKIEKNTLGLLENKFSTMEGNKKHLIEFLKALYGFKETMMTSKVNIINMKEASLNTIGIERSLNQAVRFLNEDLNSFINTMEQQISSIEKILVKSKFIVGEIDFKEEEQSDE